MNLRDDLYESFTNDTAVNYDPHTGFGVTDEESEEMFLQHLKQLGIQVTSIDRRGAPVIVAMNDDKMVAWFDQDNVCGHIA